MAGQHRADHTSHPYWTFFYLRKPHPAPPPPGYLGHSAHIPEFSSNVHIYFTITKHTWKNAILDFKRKIVISQGTNKFEFTCQLI